MKLFEKAEYHGFDGRKFVFDQEKDASILRKLMDKLERDHLIVVTSVGEKSSRKRHID